MTPQQLQEKIKIAEGKLHNYVVVTFPVRMGEMSLRYINGNFRAQGYQGSSFSRWKPNRRNGRILVKSGALRRSPRYTTKPGETKVYTNTPYAKVNNEGFRGLVRIKQHTRRRFEQQKVATGELTKKGKPRMKRISVQTGVSVVKSHTRMVNIPKRQFMPTGSNDISPVLLNAFRREIERELKKIF